MLKQVQHDRIKMVNKLFPYRLHLHIFQLYEYNVWKFLLWVFTHFSLRGVADKKPLVWTAKAKSLYRLAIGIAVIMGIYLLVFFGGVGFIFGIILATQAYVFLIIASFVLSPYEFYKKKKIISATERKLATLSHVKIIGITGSYGKTSVKEFLYQILRTKYNVLRTPGSYNTPLGIAKVVNLELDNSYDYFLCEMGAYKRGDIKEICDMVHPAYGILTGINEQHIETFGSLENTTKGKFELIDAIPSSGFSVVNGDNERVRKQVEKILHFVQDDKGKIFSYGFSDIQFSIKNIHQTHDGTSFTLLLEGKAYKSHTKLFGKSNLQNILGAATMSCLLGMKPKDIVSAIATIQSVAHRLEIKEMGNMTLIDDAYNSNVDGFQEAIDFLKSYDRPKVFVTPGIVDLGDKTIPIHTMLGKKLTGIDYIFLIGKSERTRGLEMGIKDKKKIVALDSIKDVWGKIAELGLENPVVLLENDLPDNY